MADQQSIDNAEAILARTSAIAEAMQNAMAEALKEMRDSAINQQKLFLNAIINARQELQRNPGEGGDDHTRDQSTVMDDGGFGGTAFSIRYRNDTLRASLGLEVPDPPIHRLEWIAKNTAYDPSTITEENPTGDEWANELWQPVLHGEAVFYTP